MINFFFVCLPSPPFPGLDCRFTIHHGRCGRAIIPGLIRRRRRKKKIFLASHGAKLWESSRLFNFGFVFLCHQTSASNEIAYESIKRISQLGVWQYFIRRMRIKNAKAATAIKWIWLFASTSLYPSASPWPNWQRETETEKGEQKIDTDRKATEQLLLVHIKHLLNMKYCIMFNK